MTQPENWCRKSVHKGTKKGGLSYPPEFMSAMRAMPSVHSVSVEPTGRNLGGMVGLVFGAR